MNIWSWKKCGLVSLRLGLFSAVIVAVFWYVWSLYAPVPVVTSIMITQETLYTLSFSLSRWTDVVFTPLFVVLLATLYGRIEDKVNFVIGLFCGLAIGLCFGLSGGFVIGLVAGFAIGLVAGFVVGFAVTGLVYGVGYSLGVGLGFGLVVGLGFGLVVGLVVGLGVGLGLGFTAGIVWVTKNLKPFWLFLVGSNLK